MGKGRVTSDNPCRKAPKCMLPLHRTRERESSREGKKRRSRVAEREPMEDGLEGGCKKPKKGKKFITRPSKKGDNSNWGKKMKIQKRG